MATLFIYCTLSGEELCFHARTARKNRMHPAVTTPAPRQRSGIPIASNPTLLTADDNRLRWIRVHDFIFRVDDRLIHGQVTAGWVRPLGIGQIVLINNGVAADDWERESYSLAVPAGVTTVILSVPEGIDFLKTKTTADSKKTMVVVASLKDAVEIIEGGIMCHKLHIGGLHFETGRRCLASYICLDDEDGVYLKRIIDRGITVEGREIPGGPTVDVWALFLKGRAGC